MEGLPDTNLQNLRTEIVLRDANDVAFWFSFSFRVAMFRTQKTGNRAFQAAHQSRVKPTALFPRTRNYGEKIRFGEEESSSKD